MSEVDIGTLRELSDTQIVNTLESLLKFTTQFKKIVDTGLNPALDELILALSVTLNNASPKIKTTRRKGRT